MELNLVCNVIDGGVCLFIGGCLLLLSCERGDVSGVNGCCDLEHRDPLV